jgi:hypothetical protein
MACAFKNSPAFFHSSERPRMLRAGRDGEHRKMVAAAFFGFQDVAAQAQAVFAALAAGNFVR